MPWLSLRCGYHPTMTSQPTITNKPPRQNIIDDWSSPEYLRRLNTPFMPAPPTLSIKALHAAVPRHLFERSTIKSLYYVFRHLAFTAGFFVFGSSIEYLTSLVATWGRDTLGGYAPSHYMVNWALWIVYWFWQSVSFTGIWTLGEWL